MSAPSPFEIARAIGTNLGGLGKEIQDKSAIEEILTGLTGTDNPEQLQSAINQVLTRVSPQRQKSVLESLESRLKGQQDLEKAAFAAANKAPPGGLTGQPIQPEISARLEEVVKMNPDATAEELTVEFDKAGVPRAFSNAFIETRRRQDEAKAKQASGREERRSARDEKLVAGLDEVRQTNFIKRGSTDTMKNALLTNKLDFFSLDNLAQNVPGFGWATSVGAQTFRAAQKNHLISTIGQLTGRPNQWIEQQISESYAKIGRPREANAAAMLFTQFETDALTKWAEIVDRLDEQGNISPGNLGKAASREMEKWYQSEIKKVNKQIRDLADGKVTPEELFAPTGKVVMYAPDGGLLYVNEEDVERYKSLGATQP